jgi:hypothetical protein
MPAVAANSGLPELPPRKLIRQGRGVGDVAQSPTQTRHTRSVRCATAFSARTSRAPPGGRDIGHATVEWRSRQPTASLESLRTTQHPNPDSSESTQSHPKHGARRRERAPRRCPLLWKRSRNESVAGGICHPLVGGITSSRLKDAVAESPPTGGRDDGQVASQSTISGGETPALP